MRRKIRHVLFRADAATSIGTGHIMRCLTLADELRRRGASCRFLMRPLKGHLVSLVQEQGFEVVVLRAPKSEALEPFSSVCSEAEEIDECMGLVDASVDWMVLDHYGIGLAWEKALRKTVNRLMVFDDLADRPHDCDLLLNQNVTSGGGEIYAGFVSAQTEVLIGSHYALVRPEFRKLRDKSLARRGQALPKSLLVCLGGSDPHNETLKVIEGVALSRYGQQNLNVAVGKSFPHRASLEVALKRLPNAKLHIQTSQMAELMAESDLAVTAGGSITWEKCVMGLPSLVTVLADNQSQASRLLHDMGAQNTIGLASQLTRRDYTAALNSLQVEDLQRMTQVSASICDGRGAQRVCDAMENAE